LIKDLAAIYYGNKVENMHPEIYKGSRFFTCGKMDIKLHQKKENKRSEERLVGKECTG
jgi:hypothetical protein